MAYLFSRQQVGPNVGSLAKYGCLTLGLFGLMGYAQQNGGNMLPNLSSSSLLEIHTQQQVQLLAQSVPHFVVVTSAEDAVHFYRAQTGWVAYLETRLYGSSLRLDGLDDFVHISYLPIGVQEISVEELSHQDADAQAQALQIVKSGIDQTYQLCIKKYKE